MAETEGDWDPVHVLIRAAEAGLHAATSSLLTAVQFLRLKNNGERLDFIRHLH